MVQYNTRIQSFWKCKCGAEYHYPRQVKPVKCDVCGSTEFVRMQREIIPIKEWKLP